MRLLIRWGINTIAIMAAAYLLPQVHLTGWKAALVAGVLLGFLNTFVRPVFRLLALPLTILSLGLFVLVVNGFVLWILDWLMEGLKIDGFIWDIAAALIISVVTTIVNVVTGAGKAGKKRRGRG
ncbi:MAG TPA: phage holin family protein [Thermoleophilia bacterium]|nr:phage holin family protein [Thermoleophilia bacterium]